MHVLSNLGFEIFIGAGVDVIDLEKDVPPLSPPPAFVEVCKRIYHTLMHKRV